MSLNVINMLVTNHMNENKNILRLILLTNGRFDKTLNDMFK